MMATIPEKVMDSIVGAIPVGRLGEPEEIARAVVFLASDDAGFMSRARRLRRTAVNTWRNPAGFRSKLKGRGMSPAFLLGGTL